MQQEKLVGPIKIIGSVVLLAMAAAILYAFSISLMYWNGIGV
jgi:hypothetical protein